MMPARDGGRHFPWGRLDRKFTVSAIVLVCGSALIISPQSLEAEGLLDPEHCQVQFAPGIVDYDSVIPFKRKLLESAWYRFQRIRRCDLLREYEEFCSTQASWLEDYALFRALKTKLGGAYYIEWPAELVQQHPPRFSRGRAGTQR